MLHPARLWKELKDGKVQCRLCSHFCVIESGDHGICGVRHNRDGSLMTKTYDLVAAINIDPVEKNPSTTFYPAPRRSRWARRVVTSVALSARMPLLASIRRPAEKLPDRKSPLKHWWKRRLHIIVIQFPTPTRSPQSSLNSCRIPQGLPMEKGLKTSWSPTVFKALSVSKNLPA